MWRRVTRLIEFDPHLNKAASIWLNPKINIDKKAFIWKEWVERSVLVLDPLHLNHLKTYNNNMIYPKLNSRDIFNYGMYCTKLTGRVYTPQSQKIS